MSEGPSLGTRARALLEVLRAPLLLSPVADVSAGFALAVAADGVREQPAGDGLALLLPACAVGVLLLGAGMAQNALADAEDDRLRKPTRPLPRGDIGPVAVGLTFIALTGAALTLARRESHLLPAALSIVLLTVAYHAMLKRRRVLGCLTLGALRALDMGLGVLAAQAAGDALLRPIPQPELLWTGLGEASAPLLACAAYGLYVFGASLHASTDDEPDARAQPASRAGLALCSAVLAGGAAALAVLPPMPWLPRLGGAVLLLLALARLLLAMRTRPAPAVTGAALSNVSLTGAALCFASARFDLAALALLCFLGGRALLRAFPPS
ncbi:MAG: UbiA family prenyltransferase [Planctomycetes bacterium]|nr:UbiA family prenyltransferase [Planctomycetota bacterium]